MQGLGDAFDGVWEKDGVSVPGHLALLHLVGTRELAVLRAGVQRPDADTTVRAMIAPESWRTALVAATALLFLPRDGAYAEQLWRCFDAGSRVSPQLAVVLEHHDPQFVERAWLRVDGGANGR